MKLKLSPQIRQEVVNVEIPPAFMDVHSFLSFAQKFDYRVDFSNPVRPIFSTTKGGTELEFQILSQEITWVVEFLPPNKITSIPRLHFRCKRCLPSHRKGAQSQLFNDEFVRKYCGYLDCHHFTSEPFITQYQYFAVRLPYDVMNVSEAQEWLANNSDQIAKFYEALGYQTGPTG